jgi:hypothetical protein
MKNSVGRSVLRGALLLVPAISAQTEPGPGARCDRQCLEGLVDLYMDSLARHDPSALPVSPQ